MKRIAIQKEDGVYQMAVLENGRLAEWIIDLPEDSVQAGDLYLGRIVNVLPGMQAAFVDIGHRKNAFIYVDDLLHPHLEKQPQPKPSIDSIAKVGQSLLVQIAKEPVGNKGARVTTHITLPGRWLVYMPDADYVALSRKIEGESDRERLKTWAEQVRKPGEGIILRTLSKDADLQEMEAEVDRLRLRWKQIGKMMQQETAPAPIYKEQSMLARLVRDLVDDDLEELIVDNAETARQVRFEMNRFVPHLMDKIKIYDEQDSSLFEQLHIDRMVARAFARKIRLKSGGYLIIDTTEALTVIDVNTGKYTGKDNLEDTVFKTNMEAAEEIAHLLRLRDIGGIIIVDFIDMNDKEHQTLISDTLQSIVKNDRTKTIIVGWTQLGLLEITRKKIRTQRTISPTICPHCGGSGTIQ